MLLGLDLFLLELADLLTDLGLFVFNLLKLHSEGLLGRVDGGVFLLDAVDALRDLAHDFVDGGQALRVHLLLLSERIDLGLQLLLLPNEWL